MSPPSFGRLGLFLRIPRSSRPAGPPPLWNASDDLSHSEWSCGNLCFLPFFLFSAKAVFCPASIFFFFCPVPCPLHIFIVLVPSSCGFLGLDWYDRSSFLVAFLLLWPLKSQRSAFHSTLFFLLFFFKSCYPIRQVLLSSAEFFLSIIVHVFFPSALFCRLVFCGKHSSETFL